MENRQNIYKTDTRIQPKSKKRLSTNFENKTSDPKNIVLSQCVHELIEHDSGAYEKGQKVTVGRTLVLNPKSRAKRFMPLTMQVKHRDAHGTVYDLVRWLLTALAQMVGSLKTQRKVSAQLTIQI